MSSEAGGNITILKAQSVRVTSKFNNSIIYCYNTNLTVHTAHWSSISIFILPDTEDRVSVDSNLCLLTVASNLHVDIETEPSEM